MRSAPERQRLLETIRIIRDQPISAHFDESDHFIRFIHSPEMHGHIPCVRLSYEARRSQSESVRFPRITGHLYRFHSAVPQMVKPQQTQKHEVSCLFYGA